MKPKFILLLLALIIVNPLFAQPGNKNCIPPIELLREAAQTSPPYSQEFMMKVLKTRHELEKVNNDTNQLAYRKIKTSYYTFSIQYLIAAHYSAASDSSNRASFFLERDQLLKDYRAFYLLKTEDSKWKSEQYMAQQLISQQMILLLDYYRGTQKPFDFLIHPENKEWYYMQFSERSWDDDSALDLQLDSIRQDLEMLGLMPDRICKSVYSTSNCAELDRAERQRELRVQRKKHEEAEVKRKRELARQCQQDKINLILPILHAADSLFDLEIWSEAKAHYQTSSKTYFPGNHSEKRIREINNILYIQEQDSIKQNIYDTYLFDQQGILRIDSSYQLGLIELENLKKNRIEISKKLIQELRKYDKRLLKSYHKNRISFTQYQNTTPNRITTKSVHIYRIEMDSSSILKIDHKLYHGDSLNGLMADSILQIVLPSIFPILRLDDGEIHSYLIPILYIPERYGNDHRFNYYSNCQELGGWTKLKCIDEQTQTTTLTDPAMFNSKYDEFYFVITEGKTLGPHPPRQPIIEREIQELKPMPRKRFRFRKRAKN